MSASILTLPAHVAGISSHTRAVIVKASWIKPALGRRRVLQGITGSLKPTNPVCTQSIVDALPLGNGKTAGRRRGGPCFGACLPASPRRGNMLSGFVDFFRSHQATGKPSLFFFSLVDDCRQTTSRVSRSLGLSPVPFVAAAHVSNIAEGLRHERQVPCKG